MQASFSPFLKINIILSCILICEDVPYRLRANITFGKRKAYINSDKFLDRRLCTWQKRKIRKQKEKVNIKPHKVKRLSRLKGLRKEVIMPQNLRVDEVIAERTVESEVVRNVSIPADRPAAARVVSVNARVEIRSVDLETGFVVINGIIRSTIYYATAEDPSNVVSIRSNFIFTERVAVRGARRGYEADAEAVITDIDFSLINQRSINLEFTLMIDLDISAVDVVPVIPPEGISICGGKAPDTTQYPGEEFYP